MYRDVWRFTGAYCDVWECIGMYGDVQGCMVMCRRCMCIPTFTVKKKTNLGGVCAFQPLL